MKRTAICIPLREAALCDVIEVGSKCHRLGILLNHGFRVPEGVCLTVSAFAEFLRANPHLTDAIATFEEESDGFPEETLTCAVLPPRITHALDAAYRQLCGGAHPLIVRSSAVNEDLSSCSFSGIYRSIAHITNQDMLRRAVISCWASYWHPGAVSYRRRTRAVDDEPEMALIIQQMILPRASGVAASANVRNGSPLEVMVTAGPGFGEGIVSAGEAGDQWIVDFGTLNPSEYIPAPVSMPQPVPSRRHRRPSQTKRQLKQVVSLVKRIDRILNCRVEVEWALADGKIWCLQARPLVNLPSYYPPPPWPLVGREIVHWDQIISPFALSLTRRISHLDTPWPPEVEAVDELAGRQIVRVPKEIEAPDAFLHRMQKMQHPEVEYQAADEFLRRWPQLTLRLSDVSTSMLSLPMSDLRRRSYSNLYSPLNECLSVEADACGIYIGVSYPTYEYLRRVEYLCKHWLGKEYQGNESDAHLWAISLLQGAPKRTLARDTELAELAATAASDQAILRLLRQCKRQASWLPAPGIESAARDFLLILRRFAARYGYSWAFRREVFDLASWQSWVENPVPLVASILAQAHAYQHAGSQIPLPYSERVRQSRRTALQRRDAAMCCLRSSDGEDGAQRARLFQICVEVADKCLPLKDERDLVLAHADSALRWVLLGLAQKIAMDILQDMRP